jgi:dolichyl-phosphate-mannose--protein O-mannosyl transferase
MLQLPAAGPRRDLAICLLLMFAAAAFRLPRLGRPAEEVFDEVYHAKTAQQYLDRVPPTEWVHPPTAKLLIAVPVYAFGYEPWAWRLAPAVAGILLAPVFFLLARLVLASERAALLAALLLLCDGVYLVQSRIAMTNIFAVLFQVGATYFVLRASLGERLSTRWMLLAGLALGLALSTRWTSLWAWAFLALTLLVVRRRRLFAPRELLLAFLAFAAIPIALYVLSYVPWMLQGPPNQSLRALPQHTRDIWNYHAGLVAEHPYFSKWYTWPWLVRPTWYHYKQIGDRVIGIVALGNPAVWWVSLPLAFWAYHSGLWQHDPRRLFVGAGYFCLYLPWGLSPRTLNYSHYLFEAIPYTCLALGLLLDREWDGRHRQLARAYVGLVIALFLYFLPLLIGYPFPASWFFHNLGFGVRPWSWFRTWI